MKLFQLAVVFLVVVALLAGTPALAALGGTVQLTHVGDESGATGTATLTKVNYLGGWNPMGTMTWMNYKGYLTVTCTGLTPGATYSTPAGTFKADRSGKGTVKRWVYFGFMWWWDDFYGWCGPDPTGYEVDVLRLNPDGSSTLVLIGAYPYY
jgi:hypothetical protein